ncbi:MAG: HNH endonuclease [Proteobacteria bacterium]|nr:HNH endonuclease [Pseudomonadota bacterium]
MTREAVLAEVCRRAVAGVSGKSRRRTVVVMHYDRGSDRGWMETDRGAVPVSASEVHDAVNEGRVVVASEDAARETAGASGDVEHAAAALPDEPGASGDVEPQPLPVQPRRGAKRRFRQRPTVAVIDALHARSNGRCEQCGQGGFLHVHHQLPWSRGGDNSLDNLRLLCSACHDLHHQPDFKRDEGWAQARNRAVVRASRKAS